MSDEPTMMGNDTKLEAVKPADLKVTAPEFVPLAKKTTEPFPKLAECLSSGLLPESLSGQISVTPEDALSTPIPTSVSSFTQLVQAARDAPPAESAEVSMVSMTDDDSDISSADVSVVIDPKTPMLPLSDSVLSDLDISPTGGIGGGVRCGMPRSEQSTPEPVSGNRVFEGLVPQETIHEAKPKYRPYPPQRSCNIHIQNLPTHYGDGELSALCEEFGHIVSVRVFRRPVAAPPNRRLPDGQHSTYGFVLFDNVISAENCVNALRQRYKNIYPSFARQTAPAVHQPAFVGLLEAMAYGDLHQADPNPNPCVYGHEINPGLVQPVYYNQGAAVPGYNVPIYEAPVAYEMLPASAAPAYEAVPEVKQLPLVSAPVEAPATRARPQALTIKPMPPPIQSYVPPSTTTDRINSVLNEGSILLIVDGLPKDFGVGLLDTLFAPHPIHDVRLHRQGASDGVRGSVRVSNRLAALQSIEKLSGMQFGSSAGGLRVRLAEEVSGDGSDAHSGVAPALPSYRTLPDIQECRSLLVPPKVTEGPLASSTSAPAVASMIGSGLNQLLFASDSNDSLIFGSQRLSINNQLSPSTGRLLASPARLAVPFAPAMASSISMPHVAPRFLSSTQSYGLLPSLRVGDVNLPITSVFPSHGSLYACGNATSINLQDKLMVPEPPVIKVSSYASAVKKPVVRISSPDDQKAKKRKSERPGKRNKNEDEKNLSGAGTKLTLGGKTSEKGQSAQKEQPSISTKKLAEDKKNAGESSPEQTKSTASKAKKWSGTRRRSNSKLTAAIKA
ncbi:hypothetical protein FRC12_014202 [Ceratobasidium sp. 428]|nr:hypothetical protein FRC12_014202 [Ceratobasidium sp. 428]